MKRPGRVLVAGEPIDLLVEVTLLFGRSLVQAESGMWHGEVELTDRQFTPLYRALLRVESDLLRKEANTYDGSQTVRTATQRRCDAMVMLMLRVAKAARASEREISAPPA